MFAIDISKNTIRLLKLEKEGNTFSVYGAVETKFDEIKALKDLNIISIAIKNGMERAKPNSIEDKEVGFSIPEEHSFIKILNIDNSMPKDKISSLIEKEIPYSLDEIYWDYQELDNKKIIFSAAPKKIVDTYIEIARLASLKTVLVETESNALVWGSLYLSKIDINKNILLLYIDKSKINIVIWSNNAIQFTTNDKFEYESATIKSPNKKDVENLTYILEKYINFYNEHLKNQEEEKQKIDEIILTGIWENYLSLKKELANKIGIPVVYGPSRLININSTYTIALGIALRGMKIQISN
ncbi:MAG: pilus assembly protein PilM [Patescibacteria group bacterium]